MSSRSLRSYPRGLYVLCAVQLLERIAGGLLLADLALYLNEYTGSMIGQAARLAGLIHALSYGLCIVGGIVADRWLGPRMAMWLGSILLGLGYLVLTETHTQLPWSGLILLVAGSALFKPNVSALIGLLTLSDNERREGAFRLQYFAINLGAVSGPLASGLLRRLCGWPAAFALCVAAMAGAVIVGALGWRSLATQVPRVSQPQRQNGQTKHGKSTVATALGSVLFALMLFMTVQTQSYKTLLFWARDRTDRTVLGFEIPPDWFASLACVLVLIMLPLVPPAKASAEGASRETAGYRRIAIGFTSGPCIRNDDGGSAAQCRRYPRQYPLALRVLCRAGGWRSPRLPKWTDAYFRPSPRSQRCEYAWALAGHGRRWLLARR